LALAIAFVFIGLETTTLPARSLSRSTRAQVEAGLQRDLVVGAELPDERPQLPWRRSDSLTSQGPTRLQNGGLSEVLVHIEPDRAHLSTSSVM
jgi:hypothetical protein